MASVSSFAAHGALRDPTASPMHEREQALPSSCWGSVHPDILQMVAAHLPASGNYGPGVDCGVDCVAATLVCKAWRLPFLARLYQTREGVLQPQGGYKLFGGLRLTPPKGWARMISSGGLSCLDLSRLPWADYSHSFPEELLKAANAYAVGIAQLAPVGLSSLVLWLGDGCKAAPGVVNRYYAPLLLRPLPLLTGLTSLEASLAWEGVGPLVSSLRELLADDDCKLSDLRLRLRVPTYRDITGLSPAEDPRHFDEDPELVWERIAQDPAVQAAMQLFQELRQLVEGHPDLSVDLCAKVCFPLEYMNPGDIPMGETLGVLDGLMTELELLDGGLPPGTPDDTLRGVKRLVMVEDSLDPGLKYAQIHTGDVLDTLAALPALEEVVLDVGGASVSFLSVIRHLALRSPGISYLEAVGFWQKRPDRWMNAYDTEADSINTGVMDEVVDSFHGMGTRSALQQLGLVEGESLVLKKYRS